MMTFMFIMSVISVCLIFVIIVWALSSYSFRRRLGHKDPKIRITAIKEVVETDILLNLALTDPDKSVRLAALNKLSDVKMVTEIAKSDPESSVRIAAISKLSHQPQLLSEIVKNDPDNSVKTAALRQIFDFEVLEEIANNYPIENIRASATRQINYQIEREKENILRVFNYFDLEKIASSHRYNIVREAAIERLSGETILHKGYPSYSFSRLQDFLNQVAKNEPDSSVRSKVIEILKSGKFINTVCNNCEGNGVIIVTSCTNCNNGLVWDGNPGTVPEICPYCNGTGQAFVEEPCTVCNGIGKQEGQKLTLIE